jgi:FkbM family methyltransferase
MIPIIIICYNNHQYIENTIQQIQIINPVYLSFIQILDNKSTDPHTIQYLSNSLYPVIYNHINGGPRISTQDNPHIYHTMPEQFIITDPDLEFNENLPPDFIERMIHISNKYNAYKVGFALRLDDYSEMFKDTYYTTSSRTFTIEEWESQFWNNRINDDEGYTLYNADIDTTFCIIKKNSSQIRIRMAGNFLARHIPWYIDNPIFTKYENYVFNLQQTYISTVQRLLLDHIHHNYHIIQKNSEKILIFKHNDNPDDSSISFWLNEFPHWKNDLFVSIDNHSNHNKIMIDIGAKFGAVSLYASRKFKEVIAVESVVDLYNTLLENILINSRNISTHLCSINIENKVNNDYENSSIPQLSFSEFIRDNNISLSDIGFINIDIDGLEENILLDVYEFCINSNIPIYVTIYYEKWINKDLNRFEFLTENHKREIQSNHVTSFLFEF